MEFTLTKSTNRHFFNTILVKNPLKSLQNSSNLTFSQHTPTCTIKLSNPTSFFKFSFPNLKPLLSLNPFSVFSTITTSLDHLAGLVFGNDNNNPIEWNLASDHSQNNGHLSYGSEGKKAVVTVVMLGWLGCGQTQLRKYVEMYNMFGFNVVTFATSVNDVLDFVPRMDNVKARLEVLIDEIVEWMMQDDGNEEERFLVFHTFSNIGWLAYGAILNMLQGREEILKKIKGCVVDSGGVPELDPKVCAAEFTTTMLSMVAELGEIQNGTTNVNTNDEEVLLLEAELFANIEEFITQALESPDEDVVSSLKRLTEVTSTLSENQPSHPQLYLYSTADKVIPFQKIESFAKHQKKLGRKVTSFNFESSQHVDHYRAFPDKYRSLIQSFLKDCLAVEGRQWYKLLKY